MEDLNESKNALWRRENQLRCWDTSETNSASSAPRDRQSSAVRFHDGCVFLAACSSGDTKEVVWLLGRGADINTANVDGLTALHQACIDDNLAMVRFLVEHGADIDACDNEGWTALHATASCGFVDIARYLIEKGARLDAVNNDGELALDLAEGKHMSALLLDEMEKQGIDAEAARKEEEEMMLRDANQWLNGGCYNEQPHPKTGALALHVAAAKGYIKVIKILLESGADVNAKDLDGWTPLHAAAHWGQDEACKILAEHFGSLSAVDNAGRTPVDVADADVERLLEELKKQQDMIRIDLENRNRNSDVIREISPGKLGLRRSSVTRLSVDQKQILAQKNAEDERLQLRSALSRSSDEGSKVLIEEAVASPGSEGGSDDATALVNKQLAPESQPLPAQVKTNELAKANEPVLPATSKLETTEKSAKVNGQTLPSMPMVNGLLVSKPAEKLPIDSISKTVTKPCTERDGKSVSDDELVREKQQPAHSLSDRAAAVSGVAGVTSTASSTPTSQVAAANAKLAVIGRQAANVGAKLVPEPPPAVAVQPATPQTNRIEELPAMWRASLRKTGSADIVCPLSDREAEKQLPRSSSVSWGPPATKPDVTTMLQEPVIPRRMGSAHEPETKARTESIIPQQPQQQPQQQPPTATVIADRPSDPYTRYKAQLASYGRTASASSSNGIMGRTTPTLPTTLAVTSTARTAWTATTPTTITTRQLPSLQYIRRQKTETEVSGSNELPKPPVAVATVAPVAVTTSTTVSGTSRRLSEVPKRDDEKEIERKARAKRARESRRSTQGVSKEDIEKAGASLQAASSLSSSGSVDENVKSPPPVPRPTAASLSVVSSQDPTAITTTTAAATSPKTVGSLADVMEDPLSNYRKSRDSGTFGDIGTSISSGCMRTLRDAGLAAALANAGSPTSPVATTVVAKTTASVTTSPSTAVTVTAAVTTTTPSVMVPKTTSEHTLPGNSSEDGEDSLLMTAAARARRRRETRRPPLGGLQSISLDAKSGLERRPSDDTRTDTETKSVTGRLSDTPVIVKTDRLPATCLAVTGCSYSLVPSPVATTTTPQPATTLADEQVDFKMMYERERRVAEQLQTELRDAKHDLVDARSELERLRNVTTSSAVIPSSPVPDITSDRRERRALERKISELEEELKIVETLRSDNQRLRDENGALIRVISKLSK